MRKKWSLKFFDIFFDVYLIRGSYFTKKYFKKFKILVWKTTQFLKNDEIEKFQTKSFYLKNVFRFAKVLINYNFKIDILKFLQNFDNSCMLLLVNVICTRYIIINSGYENLPTQFNHPVKCTTTSLTRKLGKIKMYVK